MATSTLEPVMQACVADESPHFAFLKARQRAIWASGDYAVIGATLPIVSEQLCEALDLRSGQRVLDVAAGHGNASLAAARRWCDVVSTDYVPALLGRGRTRAAAERLSIEFREADAERLPFSDSTFDVVMSVFGVMFATDPVRAADELSRVCRAGGKIGLASWTPEGFVGALLRTIARHVRPPFGVEPAALWGTESRLSLLFGDRASEIRTCRRDFVFRYRSPQHWIDVFRRWYGPVRAAFESLDAHGQAALESDLLEELHRGNRSGDATLVIPGEYLEAIISRGP